MKILRSTLYLALGAAVVYGGYLAYTQWVQGRPLSDLWSKATQYASTTQAAVGQAQKSIGLVEGAFASATQAFSSAKETVGSVLSGIGGGLQSLGTGLLGAPSASSAPAVTVSGGTTQTNPSPAPAPASSGSASAIHATVTTAVGEPLYFSLTSGAHYDITWGDGTESSGALNEGTATVVRHTWNAAGNYTVNVSVDGHSYTFPIRVYNQ